MSLIAIQGIIAAVGVVFVVLLRRRWRERQVERDANHWVIYGSVESHDGSQVRLKVAGQSIAAHVGEGPPLPAIAPGARVEVIGWRDDQRLRMVRLRCWSWLRVGLWGGGGLACAMFAAALVWQQLQPKLACAAGFEVRRVQDPQGWRIGCADTHGIWHGRHRLNAYTGQLREQGSYWRGQRDGDWRFWYKNGQLSETAQFQRGKRHGVTQRYARDGHLTAKGQMKQGKGDWQYFSEQGKVIAAGPVVGEHRHGAWIMRYADGTVREQGQFKRGKQTGPWRAFHENGKRKWRGSFDAIGRKHGTWQWWDKVERPSKLSTWRHGKRFGPWKVWHDSGEPHTSGQYGDKGRQGLWSYFDSQGNKQFEGTYRNGIRTGRWTWWCKFCGECEACREKGEQIVTKDYTSAQHPAR